ncbi:acetyltransferase [Colletotrichum cuscutae]|uniref:Acetyltransferase n=1 Tax=Colletotrichum cuscutae TaxID=1209917 RepID=A0AAI9U2Z3_9PEZI|nr:acetyltransferase [Colletotrichum cuscutae]
MTVPENFPFGEPEEGLTFEKLPARMQKFAKMSADGKNAFLVVEPRGTDELIGYGGYNTPESVDPPEFLDRTTLQGSKAYMTDIGIIIDHKHWRKGYGLELISVLIEYAKNELGCQVFRDGR